MRIERVQPVLIGGWLLLVLGLSPLFYLYDFGHGPLRTGLLALWLLSGLYSLARLRQMPGPLAQPPAGVVRAVLALCVLSAALHVAVGLRSMQTTARTDGIALDQGQNVYRAIVLFDQLNPYGRDVLLDPVYYLAQLKRWVGTGCLRFEPPAPTAQADAVAQARWRAHMLQAVERFWKQLDVPTMRTLMPAVHGDPRCDGARFGFQSLGFKYGPLDIAAYVPAVWVLGKPGVFLTQGLAFLVILGLCVSIARLRGRGEGARGKELEAASAVVLVVLLGTVHLKNNVLETSALDAVPTALALLALRFRLSQHHAVAALSLGLSLAAKPLPGLLYVPLLLGLRPVLLWLCAGAALLPYLPFALWDGVGLLNNVLLYPLTRHSDSTALAHFLSPSLQRVLLAVCGLVLLERGRALWRRRADTGALVAFIFAAHLLVLIASRYLHNNYMTWLSPALALFGLELWLAGRRPGAAGSGAGAEPGAKDHGATHQQRQDAVDGGGVQLGHRHAAQ